MNTKGSPRVLIVEDDLELKEALIAALQSLHDDMVLEWVASAEEALQKLVSSDKGSECPYDLLVVDIRLPGPLTGIDLWKEFYPKYPRSPFVLMSGMDLQEYFSEISGASVSPSFLMKPFSPMQFKGIVTDLLKKNY